MLESQLSIAECWTRLMMSPASADGGQVLRFQVPGNEIMLRFPSKREWWRRWYGAAAREAFRTFAYIKLQPGDRATQVQVTLRSHYFVAVFVTAWIALVALFNAATVAIVVTGGAQPYGLVVPFFLVGLGISFIPLCRFLVRSERAALLDFVGMVMSVR